MAALEKIRNRAGLLIGVVGLALFAFIIGDFLNSGTTYFGMSKNIIGEVEGSEMTITDFQEKTETFRNVVKMQYNQNPEDGDVRDAVWNEFVMSSILKEKSADLGVSVSVDEMKELTVGDNTHPMMGQIRFLLDENGRYDKRRLSAILANKDKSDYANYYNMWIYWESELKNRMMMDKYQRLLWAALSPTKKTVEAVASYNNAEMDLAVVRKNYYEIADSTISVSDAELKAKYEKMKPMLKTDGYRSLKVIVFDINPSENDFKDAEFAINDAKSQLDSMKMEDVPLFVSQTSDSEYPYVSSFVAENEVDAVFKDFAFSAGKGAVSDMKLDGPFYKVARVMSDVQMRPDSVKTSRIIVFRGNKEESKKLADSLMAELKKGADFGAMVKSFSQDNKNVIANGGDMGWMKEGMSGMDEFDEAVFTANVDQIVSVPVQEGFFLMKITERTKSVKKVKLAVVANKVEPSTDTYRNVYDKAKQFILANRTLAEFEESAKKEGLAVMPLDRLGQNQSKVYVLDQPREMIKWAWEQDNIGEVSEKVFEIPGKCVVAAVSEVVEKGYIPMAQVKAQLESDVRKDKKAEILMKDLAGKTDLAAVGTVDTATNVKFLDMSIAKVGNEPAILGAAYKIAVDAVSAPIKGNAGVYLFRVLAKRSAAPMPLDALMAAQKAEVQSMVNRSMYQVLMDNSNIEDNRYNFY
ncbi:MAG: SurA N-terminal domain-containing protein [Paludibacteraceae bacterium]|nr:SurA N-terminal domain-containing protein [Prevotellaceae bacterium]